VYVLHTQRVTVTELGHWVAAVTSRRVSADVVRTTEVVTVDSVLLGTTIIPPVNVRKNTSLTRGVNLDIIGIIIGNLM